MSDPIGQEPTSAESLPPVKPPSAGFLIQLFVVPMVIVSVIVMFCLLFNWMARRGSDPAELISDLRRGNPGSWQKALDVANLLNDPSNDELRRTPQLARQLANMLDAEIEEGHLNREEIDLRNYLCLALGVVEVPDGLDELVKAATTQRSIDEAEVRKVAIEAIAKRLKSKSVQPEEIQANQKVMDALIAAAEVDSEDPQEKLIYNQLRYTTAYTLGVVGGESAMDALAGLVNDPVAAVRFNAATGLARHGDRRSVRRLSEMLDANSEFKGDNGKPVDRPTRDNIMVNGLRASLQLLKADPEVEGRERLMSAAGQIIADANSVPAIKKLAEKLTAFGNKTP